MTIAVARAGSGSRAVGLVTVASGIIAAVGVAFLGGMFAAFAVGAQALGQRLGWINDVLVLVSYALLAPSVLAARTRLLPSAPRLANVTTAIGLASRAAPFTRLLKRIYRLFRDKDCLLLEINPFIETEDGDLMALDAKMSFDDNSLFRRGDVAGLRDFDEEDPKEVDAGGHGLNYIALDGTVGCIVNGAGLAMATMDAIVLHGGRPANFLDVGGGASPEKVANAFRIVMQDPNVRTILVNIFAGINRCDWIAQGVVQATRDQAITVPVVVRLAGTNVDEGRAILDASGLDLIQAEDLDDAASKAVAAVDGVPA